MTITKKEPFSKEEMQQLAERYEIYIKTVIDTKQKICSAGCDLHADSEKILLQMRSQQEDIWGGGINLETKEIDFNSFINIRPKQNNSSIEIQSSDIRDLYTRLTKFFFKELYE